jgi:Flp pilus assembly protein TadG
MPFALHARIHALLGERAQSLVETALVFPLLIIVLVGAVEMARVARASIAISNAARAAVQYGAQDGTTAQDTTGMQTAASGEAPNLTVTTTPVLSCTCSDGTAAGNCLTANNTCLTSHKIETVTVSTQATVTPTIHLPGLPTSFIVKGKASQRCLK